jgi:aspartyl-tRNA(Asn)/glutamyl-tRNA(Gln) amidotransferase subunit B
MTITQSKVRPAQIAALIELIGKGTISGKIAKTVFSDMFKTGRAPEEIVKEQGLVQVTDEGEIEKFALQAIEDNPAQTQQYKEGKKTVLQFFVGQVMKLSKGKANPQSVQKILRDKLDA